MTKNCIISFANRKGNYAKALARLTESLRHNFDGDLLGFLGEASCGAPLHEDNPYAFKIYAFDRALEAGYRNILWLDSSCFAIKNVQPLFDSITGDGFLFQEAGHRLGTWCNDFTLKYFKTTREKANQMFMVGNAGMMGLDFEQRLPNVFFNKWKESMQAGCFKGSWSDHRHDMSCSSFLVNSLDLWPLAKRGNEILQYGGLFDETINDTIIIKAQGM